MFFAFISRIFGTFLFRGYLEADEKVIFVAHKHFWTHYRPLLKKILFGILMPAIIWFLFPLTKYIMLIWGGIGILFFVYELMDWYFDAMLITSLSLLIVEWNGFFNNASSRIEYQTIEGVSWSKKGFAQTIFGFGDIEVSKIGTGNSFILANASNPKEVERQILRQQNLLAHDNAIKNSEALKDLLVNMIHQHKL